MIRLKVGLSLATLVQLAVHSSHAASPAPRDAEIAATHASRIWTIERALDRAMIANPELLVAKQEYERQTGVRMQIRAELLPALTASGSANRRQPGLVDTPPDPSADPVHPPTTDERISGLAKASYNLQVEIRQMVFDGLGTWQQLKRQDLLRDQAYQTLRGTVLKVASAVRQGFDAILMGNAVVAAEQRRVEEFAQVVAWTERKHEAGDIPQFELLRAEAELQGARAELAESVRQLRQAEQSFRRLLQISELAGPVEVQGEFAARQFDLPIDEAIAQARTSRPDLAAAELAVRAAQRNLRSTASAYLPKVEMFAAYGTRSSYYNSEDLLRGWTVGAAGQWALFDGGANRGRRITLRAELRQAEARLAEVQHDIAAKLHELYENLAQTKVSMESQVKSLELAERALRDARRLYEVGQASLEQVLQAEMTHRRAMSRMNEAIHNHNSLVADIEVSVGGQLADSLALPETWKP